MNPHYRIGLVIVLLFTSCSTHKNTPPERVEWDKNPIFTEQIGPNLYMDRNEMHIHHYIDFQHYIAYLYGEDSEEYRYTLPDFTVFEPPSDLPEDYFTNEIYHHFPMVGITWEQAMMYAKWRTDRIGEMLLIDLKITEIHEPPHPDSVFTYHRYLSGDYYGYKPVNFLEAPIYRLPTREEWEKYVIPMLDKKGKKFDRNNQLHECGTLNEDGMDILNLRDNVSEMLLEKGKAIGGNWIHEMGTKVYNFEMPTQWLGVRFVAEFDTLFGKVDTVQHK